MEGDEQVTGVGEKEIWLDKPQEDLGLDLCLGLGFLVDDDSILYADFPPLPEFPCMSSSSSTSSTPAPAKPVASSSTSSSASSSSSAASWAVLRSDTEDLDKKIFGDVDVDDQPRKEEQPLPALSSTASMEISQPSDKYLMDEGIDCLDIMEDDLGYMDLLDNNDMFDPSTLFSQGDMCLEDFQQDQMNQQEQTQQHECVLQGNNEGDPYNSGGVLNEDLSLLFLDWLKSNKETISADDLRNIRIKKATIDCAARRLGGGKEGLKQLLKLILDWVEIHHLHQRKTTRDSPNEQHQFQQYHQDNFQNPNPTSNMAYNPMSPEQNQYYPQSQWMGQPPPPPPHQQYSADPTMAMPQGYPPAAGYNMADPYGSGGLNMNGNVYPSQDYNMVDSAQSWQQQPAQFAHGASPYTAYDNNLHQPAGHPLPPYNGYANPYPYPYVPGQGGDQMLMRVSTSATKEARKKRMARQRRFSTHPRHQHHNHNHNRQNQNQNQNQCVEQQGGIVGTDNAQANGGNWVLWPPVTGGSSSVSPLLEPTRIQPQSYPRQGIVDRRQLWKSEKNLRFLLQKVLKQSDVGNLGRIVLPKKEAETHLPELEARDGISIPMEDIGTSRVWNMRYRFWPNNKSRMYLLENTGDFVRANDLQEGDFIVLYSDVKCGKYLIRGVKVRQPTPKPENKRPAKSQKNQNSSSPAPQKEN